MHNMKRALQRNKSSVTSLWTLGKLKQHVNNKTKHCAVIYFTDEIRRNADAGRLTEAYSGTLTRREIVQVNASLGELRRVKGKLSLPNSCEIARV